MTKRMLIDASHPEETRVVVLDGNRVEEFDLETATRKPLKGNIYLAKVVRVEPSLQAAFVEYGGNRHGFLAFGEIHPDYYQIPIADRQRLLEMQAEEARAEEEADLPPESAMDRAAEWNGEGPEAWTGDEEAGAAETAADEAGTSEAAAEAGAVAEEAGEAVRETAAEAVPAAGEATADLPAGDVPAGEATATEAPSGEAAAAEAAEAPSARKSAQALDMADDRITGTPDAGMPVEPAAGAGTPADGGEAAEGEAAEAEYVGRVESVPADEPPPPPETIGGEDLPPEAEEERRERRIPPRFLRHYKIQEVIKRRQIMLVQVVKEERGGKGAALTTYISLAGRFSVLMPNSPRGGGVSRKITSAADRKRLREVVEEMNLPDGMSLIVRTAGAQRPKPEIKRDCEYLLRLWDNIRERTLASTAPALIYEEADLIKRSIRDVFGRDIEEVTVEGDEAYSQAREFMRMLMPANASKVRPYREAVPLFARYGVDQHLDAMHSPVVQLRSGGYIVINQTEALVAIDVNSGRATRDRHIEDTALRTNLEAADEIARQLRLRDLAGLIVIDFIDMESSKHDGMVERRLKEALKQDRARIQVGRISHFGLLEMSRQRLRPSIAEQTFHTCPHCQGRGIVRSVESSALQVLRAIEEEGAKRRAAEIMVRVAAPVALWLLNRKRDRLAEIEARFGMAVMFEPDDSLIPPALKIERLRAAEPGAVPAAPSALRMDYAPEPAEAEEEAEEAEAAEEGEDAQRGDEERAETAEEGERRRRRRRRRRGGRREDGREAQPGAEGEAPLAGEAEGETEGEELSEAGETAEAAEAAEGGEAPSAEGGADADGRRRRRGRRGGRRRREEGGVPEPAAAEGEEEAAPAAAAPRPARYTGPTPADPFAGQIDDIFEALEAAEAAAERAATTRPARASAVAAGVAAEAAEAVAAMTEATAAPEAAATPGAAVAPGAAAVPGAEGIAPASAAEARAEETGRAAAPETASTAEPDAVAAVRPAPAPPAPPAKAAGSETAAAEAAAAEAAASKPVPSEPAVDAEAAEQAAFAAAPAAKAEPEPVAAAAPGPEPAEPVAGPPVQPKVLGTGAEASLPKRQGWWRR